MGLPIVKDSIDNYFIEIARYPILGKAEERSLAMRWHKDKDLSAAHTLVVSNLRFVVKIALEYRNYGVNLKDLIQEGNLGLMTAVKKFNPRKNCRLITYAVWWIRAFIQEYILKVKGLVKRSSKMLKRKLFYKNSLAQTNQACEGETTITEFSLDAPLNENNARTHLDMLKDPSPMHEELIERKEETAIVKKDVTTALSRLNERERTIVEKRIMANEPNSLQEIGTELGLSRERVRQIESAALKKLKKILSPISPVTPGSVLLEPV